MTDPRRSHPSIEDLCPRLHDRTEFIPFRDGVVYIVRSDTDARLKLSERDAETVRLFDGKTPLADILHDAVDERGTADFRTIFSLLLLLNKQGFLDGDSDAWLKKTTEDSPVRSPRFLRRLISFGTLDLRRFSFAPDTDGSECFFTRSFILLLLLLAGVSIPFFWPGTSAQNPLIPIPSALATKYPVLSHAAAMIFIWLSICSIRSLKEMLTLRCLLRSGVAVRDCSLRFSWGFLFFRCDPGNVVRNGAGAVFRLFKVRMLLPLLFTCVSVTAYISIFPHPAMMTLAYISLLLFFVDVSPFLPSDFTGFLSLWSSSERHPGDISVFLRRKFIRELFSFSSPDVSGRYFIVLSILAVIWISAIYQVFWSFVHSGVVHLSVLFLDGGIGAKVLAILFLALLAIPFVLLISGVVIIVFSNIGSVIRSPLRRLYSAAASIASKDVPPQDSIVEFLGHIPLFARLSVEERSELCAHMTVARFSTARDVVAEGERGDTFYTVVTGELVVLSEDAAGTRHVLETLETADSFGETALLENVPRTATVRTVKPSVLLQLKKDHFLSYVAAGREERDQITDLIRIGALLMKSPVFSFMTASGIHRLIMLLLEKTVPDGTVICQKNEPGDNFYIIQRGTVDVFYVSRDETVSREQLRKGNFFGEIALVRDVPRTATVTARGEVTLLYITAAEFREMMARSLFTGMELDAVAEDRIRDLGREVRDICYPG